MLAALILLFEYRSHVGVAWLDEASSGCARQYVYEMERATAASTLPLRVAMRDGLGGLRRASAGWSHVEAEGDCSLVAPLAAGATVNAPPSNHHFGKTSGALLRARSLSRRALLASARSCSYRGRLKSLEIGAEPRAQHSGLPRAATYLSQTKVSSSTTRRASILRASLPRV
eukprot:CAMPEP_0196689984 /NCGR_PEP_ID=MMETSP1090-20130531/19485_1 /TAXON_ID=37098 /ORGANISM="Isochrysis sp, Strain CCMP1244" /LENGTH=171 /DNA_ID=CAMNT_0042029053 /DNA_START=328 /DNA_END=844 /DNA_ORIENTATION=-